jgi:hypothetical protein
MKHCYYYNCENSTEIDVTFPISETTCLKCLTCVTLSFDKSHELAIAARQQFIKIQKLIDYKSNFDIIISEDSK